MGEPKVINKLVRDKTPELMEAKGVKAKFHEASYEEYETELLEKLREEVIEFKNSKSIDQLADLMEVVDAVTSLYEWTPEIIKSTKDAKRTERGGFNKRLVLESTEE
jgi:predicted house-cleaning noncanonical NTP pyrophosphatase (MazG superfamily)